MRRALSPALDRRAVNDLVYGGAGVPSYATPYDFMALKAPAHWDELGPYYKPSIPEAKRLMAEAGYPTATTARWGPQRRPLPARPTWSCSSNWPRRAC